MLQVNVVEKEHMFCSVFFFFKNCVVYELMWKMLIARGRPQVTIWRIRITCWIPKATDTPSEYVIIAFSLQQWVIERVNIRLYFTYTAYLVISVDKSDVSKTRQ